MQAQVSRNGENFVVTFKPENDNETLLLEILSRDCIVFQGRKDGTATVLIRTKVK